MSNLLRLRLPSKVLSLSTRLSSHQAKSKSKGVTYENKAYPWEGVKIEKIDYSGKYGRVPDSRIMLRLMDDQTHFCKDDGLLVWQKNGATDMILYYVALAGVIICYGYYIAICYTLEYPPCPKKAMPADYYRPEEQDDGKVWHPYGSMS